MAKYESMSRVQLIEALRARDAKPAAAATGRAPELASTHGECELFFARSPQPMFIHDRATRRFLRVNDAALALYGYTRGEFLDMRLGDVRRPGEIPPQLEMHPDPTGYMHYRGRRLHNKKSGVQVDVDVFSQDILYGGRDARVTLLIDRTERESIFAELQRREREFAALVENAPDIIARFDRDLRHVYVNRAIVRAMGRPADYFIGKTHPELDIPQNLADQLQSTLRQVFAAAELREIEFELTGPSGVANFEARMVPEFDAHEKVVTVIAIARDITARKQAERELRQQKHLLDSIIDNMPVALTIKDCNALKFLRRNRLCESLFGYRDEECVGKTAFEVFSQEQAAVFHALDLQALSTRSVVESEHPVVVKNGEVRLMHTRKVPVLDNQGRPWLLVAIAEDITERKQMETRRLAREIAQRETLIREVHHRLKNNLQGIAGLLRMRARDQPALLPLIETAVAELHAVAGVFGLRTDAAGGRTELSEMLNAIVASVQGITGRRVTTDYGMSECVPVLVAEAEKVPLALVLNELIFNALKHGVQTGGEAPPRLTLRTRADSCELTISNQGALAAGFDFARGRGIGMGLDLVRSLLPPHGATLLIAATADRVRATLTLAPPLIELGAPAGDAHGDETSNALAV